MASNNLDAWNELVAPSSPQTPEEKRRKNKGNLLALVRCLFLLSSTSARLSDVMRI